MLNRILFCFFVGTVLLNTSCQKKDDPAFAEAPYLKVNKTFMGEGASAFKDSIIITSNGPWNITGAPSYLILSASSGAGNSTIYISGPANTNASHLTASLVLCGSVGVKPVSISFIQNN